MVSQADRAALRAATKARRPNLFLHPYGEHGPLWLMPNIKILLNKRPRRSSASSPSRTVHVLVQGAELMAELHHTIMYTRPASVPASTASTTCVNCNHARGTHLRATCNGTDTSEISAFPANLY